MLVPDTMRLGQLIYEINKKMIARQNNNLASLGVTVQQALVIAYLDKSKDKKVTQRMIEIGLNNTNPTVTNIIKSMMSKNLIYKIQDKVDKRMYYLYLTPLALKIAPECVKRMEDTDKAAYKNVSGREEFLQHLSLYKKEISFQFKKGAMFVFWKNKNGLKLSLI